MTAPHQEPWTADDTFRLRQCGQFDGSPQNVLACRAACELERLQALTIEQAAIGLALKQKLLPPLDDEQRAILGRPNFTCAQPAQWLRLKGHEIKRRAEDEQAAVLHWLLGLYLVHGARWLDAADEYLKTPAEDPSA